jgi:hypothetical protein
MGGGTAKEWDEMARSFEKDVENSCCCSSIGVYKKCILLVTQKPDDPPNSLYIL